MQYTQLESVLESLLFASGDPLGVPQMADITGEPEAEIVRALEALSARYEQERRGMELVRLEDKYQLATARANGPYVKGAARQPPQPDAVAGGAGSACRGGV